jgi:hypothetical protein
MGLGKTVQMIATMAMNMPDLEAQHQSTLIVVPAALLQQVSFRSLFDLEPGPNLSSVKWKDEIETKSNDIFAVHIHHGPHKLKSMAAIHATDVC